MKNSYGKKPLIVLLSLIITVSMGLSACSSSGNESNNTDTSKEGETKAPVEVSFWNPYAGKDATYVDNVVAKFNESQGDIKVKALSNQDPTAQLTAISGGNPPDLIITYWNNIGPWSEAGAVMNLEELIKKDNYDTTQINPAALDRMKVDGDIYGFPISMSMANKLLYSKKAFAEAGITAPPETLEEMFDVAKQLTKKNEKGDITSIGFMPDYPWIDNVFWPSIFGGSWDDGSGKLTCNQQANVDSIAYQANYYKEFGNDEIAKFKSGIGQAETPQDPILTGNLGMMIGWEYSYVDNRGDNGEVGIAPFPYPAAHPELKNSGMVSPVAMFIPAKAKHAEEAWTVMKFLLTEDIQIEYALDRGTIPVLTSALDNPALLKDERAATMLDFYESAKSENLTGFPNSIYINEYLQALNEETEKALLGKASAQEAMDNVVKKMQPIADKAKK
ncbi:ABC transporter substrate-binding protein [Paenibacillus marinisediminis]